MRSALLPLSILLGWAFAGCGLLLPAPDTRPATDVPDPGPAAPADGGNGRVGAGTAPGPEIDATQASVSDRGQDEGPEHVTIGGRVLDELGRPVSGARVALTRGVSFDWLQQASLFGWDRAERRTKGRGTLDLEAYAYWDDEPLLRRPTRKASLALRKERERIERIEAAEGDGWAWATTDPDGRFAIVALKKGWGHLLVRPARHGAVLRCIDLEGGPASRFEDIVVTAHRCVTVRCVDKETGLGVEGIRVNLLQGIPPGASDLLPLLVRTQTDAGGYCAAWGFRPGEVEVVPSWAESGWHLVRSSGRTVRAGTESAIFLLERDTSPQAESR